MLKSRIAIFDLDFDAILSAMFALSVSAEGGCYRCVPPDPGIAAAALGVSESNTLPGTAPAKALHTFTLDSGASRCFFHDSTTLTPLPAPVPVRLADPSGGPVVARSSTVLSCLAVPSGSLSGLHLPSFSTNLRVSICTCTRTGRHLATFTRRPGSSLYTLATEPSQVAAFAQVTASGQVAASCSCRLLTHQTLLWHHRLGHPSLPRLRGMHSRLLVSGLPRSLPPLPPSPAPPCLPCVQERQRAGPHSSSFPPTIAPLQTLYMDGSRAFVRDTSADKLSPLAIPCVFLGFVPDAPGWQFYHPTSCCVFPSQDVTCDELVPFYCLFPSRSAPPPPPPLFLAPGPPPVDPFPPQGPAPSGVSQVDPLPGPAPVQGAETGGAEPGGVATGGAERGGVATGSGEPGGAEPQGATSSGGSAGASPRLSRQQLCEWFVWRTRLRSGASGAEGAGVAGAGGTGVVPGAGVTRGTATTSPGGARTRGTGAAGTGGVEGAEARDLTGSGTIGAGGVGAGGAGVGGPDAVGAGVGGPGIGGAGAGGARDVDPGGTVRPRLYFVPLLQQVLGTPPSAALTPPLLCPPPDHSQLPLQLASPLPAPSPYTKQSGGLTERREPASRPVSRVRAAHRVPRSLPPHVPGTHAMTLRPSSVPRRVPLPAPPESSLPEVPDRGSDLGRAASPIVSRLLPPYVTDPSFESAAASALVAELLDFAAAYRLDYATALVAERTLSVLQLLYLVSLPAPEGDPDAPFIPTPRSYEEAITGPYSSQWQAAMDAEMASWKSTGTYVDEVPPPGANIVDGMWIFRVKWPPGSPPAFKARYVARGFSQCQGVDFFHTFSPTPKMTTLRVLLHVAAQRDYELHSLDFSTAFLHGSLHEKI
ncbi:unnamed protein product [Closterium sp. NIES-53]